jgi:hypothetical protein
MTPARAQTEPTPQEQELERLREQVKILQADAQKREDEAGAPPAYEALGAGTGHLEERMARVTAHVNRIPKRGFNAEQKYEFVAHSDVLDSIRPALAAEGIQFRSRITSTQADAELVAGGGERRTGGGMVWRMWRVEVTFSFVCWHEEKRCEQTTEGWPGFAQDYSDKGASKALTSAIKTFLIQQFLVSTGDDPDEPTRDSQQEPRQQQQRSRTESRSTNPADNDVRVARRACMDFNERLPTGVLGRIAKRVAGNGLVMKIDNLQHLAKITKIAESYLANPEGGEAWLNDEAQAQSGEPAPEEQQRQETAGEPEAPAQAPEEPAQQAPAGALPAADSYEPPLTAEELRQHGLGLNPRPSYGASDEDDTPF